MELQLLEHKETAEAQKSMYNSMIKALQNNEDESWQEKHLQILKALQSKQEDNCSARKQFEDQIMHLKQRCNLHEFNEKSLKAQIDQTKNDLLQEIREKDLALRELELTHQHFLSEKNAEIFKLKENTERMELAFNKDLAECKRQGDDAVNLQKEEYESKLSDIKYFYEQEQLSLKSKIRRLEEELALAKEPGND